MYASSFIIFDVLQLFATIARSKPQITKLFPVDEVVAYHQQASNITSPFDKFFGKLRATYNFVFPQSDNSSNVERILTKGASKPNLQALRRIWANQIKLDDYANFKYPNDSFLDHVKSLSVLKGNESEVNPSELEDSSVEIKSTIKADGNNVNLANVKSFNKTNTLEEDWFNDIQPLEPLELQDEKQTDKDVEIVTPGKTYQLPTTVGRHLIEWLGSLFGFTYSIYTKLSGATCGNEKATQ